MLAAIGIYGVLAYTVAQRTREVGIRMALGAGRWDALSLVLREAVGLLGVGLGAGVAGALGLVRLMERLLFEVSATDPWTFGAVALLLALVGLVASYLPARRASAVAPVAAACLRGVTAGHGAGRRSTEPPGCSPGVLLAHGGRGCDIGEPRG